MDPRIGVQLYDTWFNLSGSRDAQVRDALGWTSQYRQNTAFFLKIKRPLVIIYRVEFPGEQTSAGEKTRGRLNVKHMGRSGAPSPGYENMIIVFLTQNTLQACQEREKREGFQAKFANQYFFQKRTVFRKVSSQFTAELWEEANAEYYCLKNGRKFPTKKRIRLCLCSRSLALSAARWAPTLQSTRGRFKHYEHSKSSAC